MIEIEASFRWKTRAAGRADTAVNNNNKSGLRCICIFPHKLSAWARNTARRRRADSRFIYIYIYVWLCAPPTEHPSSYPSVSHRLRSPLGLGFGLGLFRSARARACLCSSDQPLACPARRQTTSKAIRQPASQPVGYWDKAKMRKKPFDGLQR